MTLHTRIWLHGPIAGEDAFRLSLRALLKAAGRESEESTALIDRRAVGTLSKYAADKKVGDVLRNGHVWTAENTENDRAKCDQIYTRIGQGLPGIVDCDYRADGQPLASEDVWATEFEDETYLDQRACQVELGWDTAYSYNVRGMGCSELHGVALINLWQSLPAGVTLQWQNEFTGEIFDGLNGLDSFLSDGLKAQAWFIEEAAPAIAASVARA